MKSSRYDVAETGRARGGVPAICLRNASIGRCLQVVFASLTAQKECRTQAGRSAIGCRSGDSGRPGRRERGCDGRECWHNENGAGIATDPTLTSAWTFQMIRLATDLRDSTWRSMCPHSASDLATFRCPVLPPMLAPASGSGLFNCPTLRPFKISFRYRSQPFRWCRLHRENVSRRSVCIPSIISRSVRQNAASFRVLVRRFIYLRPKPFAYDPKRPRGQ